MPYGFSINLRPLFFPEDRDANRKHIRGALVFAIEADEPTAVTWHRLEVYGFGGQVLLGGQPIDFAGEQQAAVTLEQGSNLVVVNLYGEWHDLVFPFAIGSDKELKFTLPAHGQEGDRVLFGFLRW